MKSRMYVLHILLFVLTTTTNISTAQSSESSDAREHAENQKEKVIISHAQKIVNNFFNIALNHEDPYAIGNNAADIFANMVHLVIEAVKKGHLCIDADEEEIIRYAAHFEQAASYIASDIIKRSRAEKSEFIN